MQSLARLPSHFGAASGGSMHPDRRQILKSASAALMGGGLLSRMDKVAGMQFAPAGASLAQIVNQRATGASEKLLLGPTPGEEGPPQPATVDRLPLEWNKQQVRRFKEILAQRGIEAFVLRDR